MKFDFKSIGSVAILAIAAFNLSACAVGEQAKTMQMDALKSFSDAKSYEPPSRPAVTSTPGAWLMGESVKVAPPMSPLLSSAIAYRSASRVALTDVTSYITLKTHLVIDVSEIQAATTGSSAAGSGPNAAMPPPAVMAQLAGAGGGGNVATPQTLNSMTIEYEGTVAGLLDIAANKAGVWWKFVDGKVVFYRTETKTFYLPTNSRKSTASSSITTSSESGSGASVTSDYLVDVWSDIEKTAKAVSSGAQVYANPSAGSLTVTGTPAQVRVVEDWIKGLTAQLSQQVAITIHMYLVKMTNEDTYNWDPSVVFSKASGTYGFSISPPTQLIPTGGATPATLGVSVLTGAPGKWGQYSGSQAALLALSTLGNVSETLQQTVITLNGQPAPIQVANKQGYLVSSVTTQTANVGSSTTQVVGTITTGFTATFLPRIVNGKVVLNMTMITSTLNGITTVGTAESPVQAPNIDVNTFHQSVSLTPGDALLLTGLQQDKSHMANNGVGTPENALLGGGVNNTTSKSMIAIVVSAKVL